MALGRHQALSGVPMILRGAASYPLCQGSILDCNSAFMSSSQRSQQNVMYRLLARQNS